MIGKRKEDRAVDVLCGAGYQIVDRNFYCKNGEIDIIARENGYLVFIEVKYRRDSQMGVPQEAVSYSKRQKIIKSAMYYLYKNRIDQSVSIRFDVVAILGEQVTVIKDAFWKE